MDKKLKLRKTKLSQAEDTGYLIAVLDLFGFGLKYPKQELRIVLYIYLEMDTII